MVYYVQLPKCTFDIDRFDKIELFTDFIKLTGDNIEFVIKNKDVESEYFLDDLYYELGDNLNRYDDGSYVQLPKVSFNISNINQVELDDEKNQLILYKNNMPYVNISFDSLNGDYESIEDLYWELSDSLLEYNEETEESEETETTTE